MQLSYISDNVTYHLSRSALMLAQAAGTGASAGAAAVSESDMSVVQLWGVKGASSVRFLSSRCLWIPEPTTRRETERRDEWVGGREGEEEEGGDKHVRGKHTCVHSSQGWVRRRGRVKGQWPRAKYRKEAIKDKLWDRGSWGSSLTEIHQNVWHSCYKHRVEVKRFKLVSVTSVHFVFLFLWHYFFH